MVIIVDSFWITILFSCLSLSVSSNNNKAVDKIALISQTNGANGANTANTDSGSNRNSNRNSNSNNNNSPLNSNSVLRQSCSSKSDCTANNTYCDINQHKCKCNSDFVAIGSLQNKTLNQVSVPQCLPMSKLDERCISREQCVVKNTACVFVDPGHGSFKNNSNTQFCKCKEGYHQEDREEEIIIDGQKIINHPICGVFISMGNSWIGTFAIVCIMLLIILIGCFIGILRFQRWKQRPMASTVTSLAQSSGHTPHLMSSSPPPMGSVEAEFQNDFIQVFPMHHLEPMPDKNTYSACSYVIK